MFCEGNKKKKLISRKISVYTAVLKGVFSVGKIFICQTNGKGHLKLWIRRIFKCLLLIANSYKSHGIFRLRNNLSFFYI